MNIKKKKAQIHKVLKFPMSFHILKLLYNNFIINTISYIFFNIHNKVIIKLLILHSITNIFLLKKKNQHLA